MTRPNPTLFLLALFAVTGSALSATKPDPTAIKFFETKIRPLLSDQCMKCHGEKKQKGGLRLDSLESAMQGGDGGAAVTPGDLEASLLIKAISYADSDLQMPPDNKLEAAQIADLEKWIKMGAPWPQGSGVAMKKPGEFSAEERSWWAFQPLTHPNPPTIRNPKSAIHNPIDQFVLAKLETEKLDQAAMTDRYEFARRAYFDLTGLPPTTEELERFAKDSRLDANAKLIDELLESPRYGERWAQHWLDLVRYAESDGYKQDSYRPDAWPYRDYVVRSFNADKPYDQFVKEQLAGDELNPDDPNVLIATSYLRNPIYEYNSADTESQRQNVINEISDTSGELFLGLSFGCARCHDHKFDPILQKDCYRLQAFFSPIIWREDMKLATPEQKRTYAEQLKRWEEATTEPRAKLDALLAPKVAASRKSTAKRFPEHVQAMFLKPENERTALEKQVSYFVQRQADDKDQTLKPDKLKSDDKAKYDAIMKEFAPYDSLKPAALPKAFVATDVGRDAPATSYKSRKQSADDVKPGFLSILDPTDAKITPPKDLESTGRRTALANWITRPDNQLSTRVIVNRVWQYHFGRGLVATTSDFGKLGEKPSHPELLDWLATEFVKNGWSIKWLHRTIMNSATYQQTARRQPPQVALLKDPDNRWLWRMNPRRLDSDQARDALLTISGEINPDAGGPSADATRGRRTVYTKKIRNSQDEFLHSFDAPPGYQSVAKRDETTTALQSLLMMNGDWPLQRAHAIANRLLKDAEAKPDSLAKTAFELVYSRPPTARELSSSASFLKQQETLLKKEHPEIPVLTNPLVDAKDLFGSHPFTSTKAVAFKPGTAFEKMRVKMGEVEAETFTVEAVVYLDSLYPNAAVRTIASRWNSDEHAKGWSFGITSTASRYKANNLIVQLSGDDFQGSQLYQVVASDIRIPVKTPYYVAAVITNTPPDDQKFGGTVTFYALDLSNPKAEWQTATQKHILTGGYVNAEHGLIIGGREREAKSLWDGAISRVVVTNSALPQSQLSFGTKEAAPRSMFDAQAETLASTSEPRFVWEKSKVKDPSPRSSAKHEALADLCHALINSNEFIYLH